MFLKMKVFNYDQSKEKSFSFYLDFNSKYRQALSEQISCTGFELFEDIAIFSLDFTINYEKTVILVMH